MMVSILQLRTCQIDPLLDTCGTHPVSEERQVMIALGAKHPHPDCLRVSVGDLGKNDVEALIDAYMSAGTELELCDHEDVTVRHRLSLRGDASVASLDKLRKDEQASVRFGVARNRNCSSETLAVLAKDKNQVVRSFVAQNRNCPSEALAILGRDENHGIRRHVAQNENCPSETSTMLAADHSLHTR